MHMTTIMAVVGGPLLIALVDLIRRRNSRLQRTGGFPALPVMAFPGGRTLVQDSAVDQQAFSLVDVAPPVVEEVAFQIRSPLR